MELCSNFSASHSAQCCDFLSSTIVIVFLQEMYASWGKVDVKELDDPNSWISKAKAQKIKKALKMLDQANELDSKGGVDEEALKAQYARCGCDSVPYPGCKFRALLCICYFHLNTGLIYHVWCGSFGGQTGVMKAFLEPHLCVLGHLSCLRGSCHLQLQVDGSQGCWQSCW